MFAMTDTEHQVRIELFEGDEMIGTYSLKVATLLDAIRLPDGHVVGFDRRLPRVTCIRITASKARQ